MIHQSIHSGLVTSQELALAGTQTLLLELELVFSGLALAGWNAVIHCPTVLAFLGTSSAVTIPASFTANLFLGTHFFAFLVLEVTTSSPPPPSPLSGSGSGSGIGSGSGSGAGVSPLA